MENQTNSNAVDYSDKSFFDGESMFIYNIDSHIILDVNQQAIDRYGYKKEKFLKKKIQDLGERIDATDLKIKDIHDPGIYLKDVWRHYNEKGESWLVQLSNHKFRYEGEHVILVIAHDIDSLVQQDQIEAVQLPQIDHISPKMPFGWVEWDKTLRVLDYSGKTEFIIDDDYDKIVGMSADDLSMIGKDFIDEFKKNIKNAVSDSNTYFFMESRCTNRHGDKLTCMWHNHVLLDKKREIQAIYTLIEDVSEERAANLDLKKSELTFRVMSEQSFVGIYILKHREFQYVNPRLCEITGYSEQDLLGGITILDLVHPDDLERVRARHRDWEKNPDDAVEFSLRIVSKNKKVRHVKTYGSAIERDGEQALLGVVTDQTRQVRALQSYQSLFDSITDAVYLRDEDGKLLEVNKQFEKTYGYEKDEVLGKTIEMVTAADKVDPKDAFQRFSKALKGESQMFRWWGKRKNGEIFPEEIKLSKGTFFGKQAVIAVAREISKNVKREEELKRNEQLFEQLFRNSPLGIALLNKKYKILQVNSSFEMMFGYRLKEIKGVDLNELIVPKEEIESAKTLSYSDEVFTLTKKRKTKSGDLIDVFIYGVPVVVEGKTIAMYAIYMDITDRIQAEDRIKQSLKEKEVLLAEIHHRVKNNLAVITGLLELQQHSLESEEAKDALRDSQSRINSMALIHEKLYQHDTLSNIDFGIYIKELVEVIVTSHTRKGKTVDIKMHSDPVQLPISKAIPCGLIINEIVTNSMKYAFPEGHKHPVIEIILSRQENRATIQISDNGIGLPKPFEEIGKGSLGTLLIRTLISQLDADLEVEGSDGTSYKFSFELK